MSRKNVRVIIPRNADELIELGESIVAKHNEDPLTSPLAGLDMAAFATAVTAAAAKSDEVKQLRRDAETATEDRDTLLGHRRDQNTNTPGTVLNFVVRSREILLGAYKGNEQRLGDFGYEVNQSTTGAGNGGGTAPPPTVGSIGGKLTDAIGGVVITNGLIELLSTASSTMTDANGDYVLSSIPAGNYTLRASAPGYDTVEVAVTILAGAVQIQNIQLSPTP